MKKFLPSSFIIVMIYFVINSLSFCDDTPTPTSTPTPCPSIEAPLEWTIEMSLDCDTWYEAPKVISNIDLSDINNRQIYFRSIWYGPDRAEWTGHNCQFNSGLPRSPLIRYKIFRPGEKDGDSSYRIIRQHSNCLIKVDIDKPGTYIISMQHWGWQKNLYTAS